MGSNSECPDSRNDAGKGNYCNTTCKNLWHALGICDLLEYKQNQPEFNHTPSIPKLE